jgi:hypothetical protein
VSADTTPYYVCVAIYTHVDGCQADYDVDDAVNLLLEGAIAVDDGVNNANEGDKSGLGGSGGGTGGRMGGEGRYVCMRMCMCMCMCMCM